MALQVWLPFVKDLNNQGLSNVTISGGWSGKGSIVDNGKLGKCLKTVNVASQTDYIPDFNNSSYSIGGWFKFNKSEVQEVISTLTVTSTASTATGCLLGNASYNGLGITWSSNNLYSSEKVLNYLIVFGSIRTTSIGLITTSTFEVPFDTWTHIFLVWDLENSQLKFYKNGVLFNTKNINNFSDGILRNFFINYNGIYGGNGPGTAIPFRANDIRLYDHALSVKEIELLARGLVMHYPLNDKYYTNNLIINGFGTNGQENWINSNYSTTEIPPNQSTIKASYYNGNETKELLPINPNHSYTISCYMKTTGTTSGTTYPSILPYDIDKKFIQNYMTPDGFGASYKTTLAQPLKQGDTIIYATNLSSWTTADNYYYHVAIFGYKDSTGYVYPDMVYTQDCPTFGTKTDKSNINKTNNTITLSSPYTGMDRPAGTTICQTTEGSTYYYPFGGVALSSITDWTFKTATFTPANVNRLKAMKYMYWYVYSNAYLAGNKLIDNNDNSAIVYDSSGYNNNGSKWAYDSAGIIEVSSNSARNSISTYINSDNNTTNTASGTQYIYGNCVLTTPEQLSVAFWCKPIAGYNGGTAQGQFSLTNYDMGSSAGSDYQGAPFNHRDGIIDVNGSNGTTHKTVAINFTANEWHHYVITYDGRYAKTYKDGVLSATADMGSTMALGNMKGAVIGFSKAGGVWRSNKSYYSDFRIYVTALSEKAIQELYQIGASVTKNGNLLTYEFKEV